MCDGEAWTVSQCLDWTHSGQWKLLPRPAKVNWNLIEAAWSQYGHVIVGIREHRESCTRTADQ